LNTYAGKVSSYLPVHRQVSSFVINYMIVFPAVIGIIITYYIAILNLLERTEWIDASEEDEDEANEGEDRKRVISLKKKLLAKAKKMKKDGGSSASPAMSPTSPEREEEESERTIDKLFSSILSLLPFFIRSMISYFTSKHFIKGCKLFYEFFTIIHEFFIHVFYIGNHYGLFANMTKIRYEINVYLGKTNYRKKYSSSSSSTFSPNRSRSSLEGVEEAEDDEDENVEEEDDDEEEEWSEPELEDEVQESSFPVKERSTATVKTVRKKKEKEWNQIIFSFKPDHLNYSTKTVFPFFHLPRFDWCLWFLSFKPSFLLYPKWFYHFCLRFWNRILIKKKKE
jgi:hypothetical protein